MSAGPCGKCRHGHPEKPDGGRTSSGTVWCSKRSAQMGKSRQMTCFAPVGVEMLNQCIHCKWAKYVLPHGGTPELGNVWCDRRHFEINKLRRMECFEAR